MLTRFPCIVLLALVAGVTGCGISAIAKSACNVDTDCNAGHVCSANVCVGPGTEAGVTDESEGNTAPPDAGPPGATDGNPTPSDGSPASIAFLCAQQSGSVIPLDTAQHAMDLMVGRWAYCQGGATIFLVGIELTQDRHYYQLVNGANGSFVRKLPAIGGPGTYQVLLKGQGSPFAALDALIFRAEDGTQEEATNIVITASPVKIGFDGAVFVPIP